MPLTKTFQESTTLLWCCTFKEKYVLKHSECYSERANVRRHALLNQLLNDCSSFYSCIEGGLVSLAMYKGSQDALVRRQ